MSKKTAHKGAFLLLHSETLIVGLGRFAAGEHAVGDQAGQIPAEAAALLLERGQATIHQEDEHAS